MRQDFIKFPLHLIVHPFDSFWDMKYEGKGKIRVTLTILLLVVISMILKISSQDSLSIIMIRVI